MTQNEIMHYGKKGMRWGVRRNKITTEGLNTAKSVSDSSKSGIEAIRSTSGSVHRSKKGTAAKNQASKMTDEQLKKKIQRLGIQYRKNNADMNKHIIFPQLAIVSTQIRA